MSETELRTKLESVASALYEICLRTKEQPSLDYEAVRTVHVLASIAEHDASAALAASVTEGATLGADTIGCEVAQLHAEKEREERT